MGMDMNKMLKQVAQMQEQMAKAQEELANETVEASAGGGMVTVKATGALEIVGPGYFGYPFEYSPLEEVRT